MLEMQYKWKFVISYHGHTLRLSFRILQNVIYVTLFSVLEFRDKIILEIHSSISEFNHFSFISNCNTVKMFVSQNIAQKWKEFNWFAGSSFIPPLSPILEFINVNTIKCTQLGEMQKKKKKVRLRQNLPNMKQNW